MVRNRAWVVKVGHNLGVFDTWQDYIPDGQGGYLARGIDQTNGFSGADATGYRTRALAEEAWNEHLQLQRAEERARSEKNLLRPKQKVWLYLPAYYKKHCDPCSYDSSGKSEEPSNKRNLATFGANENEIEAGPSGKRQNADEFEHVDLLENGGVQNLDNICLTSEQQAVVDQAMSGSNIFLTGAAGSGKTLTLKKLLATLSRAKRSFQVVAPTGTAAIPLGRKTVHSCLGWPSGLTKSIAELVVLPSDRVKDAVKSLQVLVIEEVSMLSSVNLERMDRVMQAIKNTKLPFGGIQLIFNGDFHQLPVSMFFT